MFAGRRNNSKRRQRAERSSAAGYAYLMALFLISVMLIASQVVLQNLVTQGRREREANMIWRGDQWKIAVRRYYQKTGHYPQTAEDLQKGLPELHFLRSAAYKDPTNTADGSWRFIYVNAAGQIIGSVKYATLQQMAIMDMNGGKMPAPQLGAVQGVPVSSMASGSTDSSAQNAQESQPGQSSSAQATSSSGGNAQGGGQTTATGQAPTSGISATPLAELKPTGPVDGPVLGAFLTGVGSKTDRSSIRIYNGGKKYNEWEFIWNPLEEQAQAVQQGLTPQAPQPGQPGQPIGPPGIGPNPMQIPPGGGAIISPPSSNQPQN